MYSFLFNKKEEKNKLVFWKTFSPLRSNINFVEKWNGLNQNEKLVLHTSIKLEIAMD